MTGCPAVSGGGRACRLDPGHELPHRGGGDVWEPLFDLLFEVGAVPASQVTLVETIVMGGLAGIGYDCGATRRPARDDPP